MGCKEWQDSIPVTKSPIGLLCLIINVLFWAGLGTCIAAAVNESPGNFEQCTFIIGILQMVTFWVFLIGWIWAIWWGVLIMQKQK